MIYLIDDEPDIVEVFVEGLRSEGLSAHGTHEVHGERLFGLLKHFRVTTLIIDHGVFKKNPATIREFILSAKPYRIIMITGDNDITKENSEYAASCHEVLYKPLDITSLAKKLK